MSEALSVEIADAVALVTMLGPAKGNAMGPAFWRELPEVMARLDEDTAVRAVVLRGSGKTFSFGLDLPGMAGELGTLLAPGNGPDQRALLLRVIRRMQGAVESIARCSKPVIAAVHGWCIGGGLDVAAACDIRLATRSAKFSLREVKLAIVADVGSLQRLPAIIGQGNLRELAYTGKDIDAERAQRMGLVNDVFDDEDKLFAGARAMALEIAAQSPHTVAGIKQVVEQGVRQQVDAGLAHVSTWNAAFLGSEDLAEAMTAFMERRTPVFRGR